MKAMQHVDAVLALEVRGANRSELELEDELPDEALFVCRAQGAAERRTRRGPVFLDGAVRFFSDSALAALSLSLSEVSLSVKRAAGVERGRVKGMPNFTRYSSGVIACSCLRCMLSRWRRSPQRRQSMVSLER